MVEFSSQAASAVELGFGRTYNLVFLIISNCPSVVLADVGEGGRAETGDMIWPGTTICMTGVVAAVNNIVYSSSVTKVVYQQGVRQPPRKLCWLCSASQIHPQSSHRLLCSVGFDPEICLLRPASWFQGQV